MAGDLLLGIDIGTQSARVALVGIDGRVVAIAAMPLRIDIAQPGWATQDPDEWWAATVDGIRRVLVDSGASAADVLAVGVDAQMHAAIPLGAGGELLSHAVALWCDKRAASVAHGLASDAATGAAMLAAANPPLPAWVGLKMRWLRDHDPELYARTRQVVTGASFINHRLTGVAAVDLSEASGYFLLDAHRLAWSQDLADLLGVSLGMLPPVLRSTDVVGHVTRAAGTLTGLLPGTPVVAGAGDMPCMLLAAGLVQPGQAVDISGTASDFCVFAEQPIVDPPVQNIHHVVDGWIPFGIAESGGATIQWIKDELWSGQHEEAARMGISPFELLDRLAAETPPGADGLLFLPYLLGERLLGSPFARGTLVGLTPRSGVGAIVRAAMEGVTFELRRTLEIAERAGVEVTTVFTTGGGARSRVWSQIKADIYERPVQTIEASEGGVVGSAILAAVGAGVFRDPAEGVARWVRTERVFQPSPNLSDRYRALFKIFVEIHDLLQPSFDRLAHIP